ncbi:MAG: acyl-CoA desaturase [Proteobacteria bacterium]|nr:acyl-CoA desaturase [Pseudomonadota bacterium]
MDDQVSAKVRVDRHVTIDNAELQRLQRRLALATMVIPFLGTIVAVGLLFYRPITMVDVVLLVVMYSLTLLGVTAGFHRLFAHSAFVAKPALRAALGILGSMAAQGTLIYWAATHRRHHHFSEGEGDPHSPYRIDGRELGFWEGLWHSHLGWMLNSKMTNTVRYAKDLIRDPVISRVNDLYYLWVALGLIIPAVAGALLTQSWYGGLTGMLWGGFVRLFLVHHVMWTSGSTAHLFGFRPFETGDHSTNNPVLAYANFGEAYHNNHHAFPYSARFGLRWWQFDLGGWAIMLFEKLGWASDVKVPAEEKIQAKRKGRGPAHSTV